jgi:crotonobetainyl-CoA:carnitine CoA-transferase CaiB-like acyl-CoA transferase
MAKGHRAVPTKDGLACVIPYTPQNFRDVFAAAGRPDLTEDPRVNGEVLDRTQTDELFDLLEECTPALTTEAWEEVCAEHSIPMSPVLELNHATEDKYVNEGHLLDVVEHPSEGSIHSVGIPVRFSVTPASIRRHAPLPGEHTEEVLRELVS